MAGKGGAAFIADGLNVDALVFRGRVAVIHPQKRADLHLLTWRQPLLPAIGGQQKHLAGPWEIRRFKAEIGEGAGLKADRRRPGTTPDNQRGSPEFVAG